MIVPYVRGYGTTRFLSSDTFRNGRPSAIAVDTIALMDALKIEKATLAGFDWGARTGNIIAALWPERCKAMVSVSGYLIGSQESGKVPMITKGGLETITQHLAMEHAKDGIRVNAVAPGPVYTPLHRETPKDVMESLSPMGRPSTVRDITDAVMYLTEAATVTGHILYVDGGSHFGRW